MLVSLARQPACLYSALTSLTASTVTFLAVSSLTMDDMGGHHGGHDSGMHSGMETSSMPSGPDMSSMHSTQNDFNSMGNGIGSGIGHDIGHSHHHHHHHHHSHHNHPTPISEPSTAYNVGMTGTSTTMHTQAVYTRPANGYTTTTRTGSSDDGSFCLCCVIS